MVFLRHVGCPLENAERRYSEDDIPGVRVNDANKPWLSDLRLIQYPLSLFPSLMSRDDDSRTDA